MDVQFLHTGEPVVVIEEGEGEPGGYVVGPNRERVWTENADYRPTKVVVLGAVTEVEPGQLAGSSYADTSTAQREAAIADGSHAPTEGVQYVHDPQQASTGSAAAGPVSAGGTDTVTPAPAAAAPGAEGSATDPLTPLNEDERAELDRLRAESSAQPTSVDPAGVKGRDTAEDTTTV